MGNAKLPHWSSLDKREARNPQNYTIAAWKLLLTVPMCVGGLLLSTVLGCPQIGAPILVVGFFLFCCWS